MINLRHMPRFDPCCWVVPALIVSLSQPLLAQEPHSDVPSAAGLFQIIFAGGTVGVSIMVSIFALSLTAMYLAIEHLLTVRRQDLTPPELQTELITRLSQGQLTDAETLCQSQPCFLSFVVAQGLAERDGGWTAVEKACEDALAEQAAVLYRRIEYLAVIGNIAPMLGLLGTVTGMILAFRQVAESQGAAGAGDLAEGIYQALVTTVGGLVVAIPALGVYALLRNRVDQLIAESTYVVQHVCRPLKRQLLAPPLRSIAPQ